MAFFRSPGSFAEVRQRTLRANHAKNVALHYFSARASPYVTWALLHTPITANGVTYSFIGIGLLAGLCFIPQEPWLHVLAWALFRLHILLDVVDGEIARYRKSQDPMGAYLDLCAHYVLYAASIFGMTFGYFLDHPQPIYVVEMFAILVGYELVIASRDTWFRAMFNQPRAPEPDAPRSEAPGSLRRRHPALRLGFNFALAVVNFNNFIFMFVVASCIDLGADQGLSWLPELRPLILGAYAMIFPAFAVARIALTMKTRRVGSRLD